MKRVIKFRTFVDGAIISDINLASEDNTIMQYTGVKDINGVEVYEGDIVARIEDRFGAGSNEYWTVQYNEQMARFQVYNQINSMRDIDIKDDMTGSCFSTDGTLEIDLEVIGNIYENGELLEER